MKKFISLLISVIMLLSFSVVTFAASFTDFEASHWAYEYVITLVANGTINGFEDGSFRPEATVTRAEFVKMIGFGPERRADDFDDVDASHWAYEYIMTSGLESAQGNSFMPDVAITRGDVAELLWKRAGSVKGITAPPVIHRQSDNYDAVSWVYTNGIMTGDDNINLRLKDTLTRAEAAALIVRSGNVSSATAKTRFMEKIDQELFSVAYNAFGVADKPYDENALLTNGELAMAAARIICDEDTPTYSNISATVSFEHEYAQPINMLCRYYLGEKNDNAEYANQNAEVKDAVAALTFAVLRSANSPIKSGDLNLNYALASNETNAELKKLLSIAYNNGICLNTLEDMPLDKEITLKEFACLLIEFDGFSGFYTADRLGFESYYRDYKIKTNLSQYPSNSEDYRIILDSVPGYVYEAPFASAVSAPKDTYEFTNGFKTIFESMLITWISRANENGVRIAATYYPGLSADNGNGYTMRVLVEVESVIGSKKLSDIMKIADGAAEDIELVDGMEFYADIETGVKINDIHLPISNMQINKIIRK